MTSATREDETIIADQVSSSYPIYQPGPQSMDFMWININTTGASNIQNQRRVPWVQKLALLANDAMNNYSREFGVDGYFFASMASSSLYQRTGSEGATFDDFPVDLRFMLGPPLFFAPYKRSDQEKEAWKNAHVQGKLQLQSLFWKSQVLDDKHLVLPIWTNSMLMPPGARSVVSSAAHTRGSPFPSNKNLTRNRVHDTTISEKLGTTAGAASDLFEGKVLVCTAAELKSRARQQDKNLMVIRLRAGGKDSTGITWARENFVQDNDQIRGFLRRIQEMYMSMPEHLITYGEAHAWGPVASFRYHADPQQSLFPLATAEESEPYIDPDPIKRNIGDEAWPQKQYKLLDRFQDLEPFTFKDSQRGGKGNYSQWSEEEVAVLELTRKGYKIAEIYQYLPGHRVRRAAAERFKRTLESDKNSQHLPDQENRLIKRYLAARPIESDDLRRGRDDEIGKGDAVDQKQAGDWSQEEDLFMRWAWNDRGLRADDGDEIWPYLPRWRTKKTVMKRWATFQRQTVRDAWEHLRPS